MMDLRSEDAILNTCTQYRYRMAKITYRLFTSDHRARSKSTVTISRVSDFRRINYHSNFLFTITNERRSYRDKDVMASHVFSVSRSIAIRFHRSHEANVQARTSKLISINKGKDLRSATHARSAINVLCRKGSVRISAFRA